MIAGSRSINILLTGNATSLRSTLIAAGRDIKSFEASANGVSSANGKIAASSKSASSSLMSVGNAVKVAKVGVLAIGAAFVYSISKAIEFDKRMRNVNSIAHMSEAQLGAMGKAVVDMSTRLPQTANTLAEGLYDIVSSGFEGKDALNILNEAAVGASAGLSTTAVSAKAIVAELNAYGMSASDAAHVNNVLFQGVNVGIMTFEELASTVGDFVGTAAAAHIGIEETTSALAAMTLSGISANESATSLNRLMASLIKPSKQLAPLIRSWGYENGEAAIKALGLRGVMEKLRESTGGNITTLLQLFPQIRAARGAFALMANDGDNYRRTSEAIAKADEGQGAAHAALAEQMKSVATQWTLFTNWVNAGAITLGSKMLPAVLSLIAGMKTLFLGIGNFLKTLGSELAPAFSDIAEAFDTLKKTAGDVWADVAPFIKALAGLALGGVVVSIKAFAAALKFTAAAADALSPALSALLLLFIGYKAVTLGTAALSGFSTMLSGMTTYALEAAGAVETFIAAAGGAAAITVGAAAVALTAYLGGLRAIRDESTKAKKYVDDLTKSMKIDPNNGADWDNAVKRYKAQIKDLNAAGDENFLSRAHNTEQILNPFESNGIERAKDRTKELTAAQSDAVYRSNMLKSNVRDLSNELGFSETHVKNLATKLKVDLSKGADQGDIFLKKLKSSLKKTADEAGMTGQQMKHFAIMSEDDMKEAMDAEVKFLGSVQDAMSKTQDVIGKFGEKGVGNKDLGKWYDHQVKVTTDFTNRIAIALQKGVDPALIGRIATAGPEAAGGLLKNIADDSTGALVKTLNAGEAAFAAANLRLMEMARITHRATTADSQQMVKDAANASRISMMTLESDVTSSSESLSKKLGIPVADVERIADEYGIVVDKFNGKTIDPKIDQKSAKEVQKTLADTNQAIVNSMHKDLRFTVAANIDDPVQKFGQLNVLAMQYVNANPTAKAYFDTLDAEQKATYLLKLINDGAGGDASASGWDVYGKAFLNIDPATEKIDDLKGRLFAYAATNPEAMAYLNTHNPEENMKYLQALALGWASTSPEAKAELDKLGPEMDFATLFAWATEWGATHKTATVDAVAETNAAEAALQQVARDRVARIKAMIDSGVAPGMVNAERQNRHGRIHSFRNGGTSTQAHVQHGERIRYAEKATGGEAFIPRRGQAGRSRRILETAAGWYGMRVAPARKMASGGVLDFSKGLSGADIKQQFIAAVKKQREEDLQNLYDEVERRQKAWYDSLPQLRKDLYDSGEARKNSRVKAVMPKTSPLFGWENKDRPGPAYGASGGAAGMQSATMVTVKIMAPVYGVDQLHKAIQDGATKAFSSNYGKFVTTARTQEDARR